MPKGVEHENEYSIYTVRQVVRVPVMPKGVEHIEKN